MQREPVQAGPPWLAKESAGQLGQVGTLAGKSEPAESLGRVGAQAEEQERRIRALGLVEAQAEGLAVEQASAAVQVLEPGQAGVQAGVQASAMGLALVSAAVQVLEPGQAGVQASAMGLALASVAERELEPGQAVPLVSAKA